MTLFHWWNWISPGILSRGPVSAYRVDCGITGVQARRSREGGGGGENTRDVIKQVRRMRCKCLVNREAGRDRNGTGSHFQGQDTPTATATVGLVFF